MKRAVVASFAAVVLATYVACVRRTGGAYVYPIDDAYIHLAIAKNLVASGTYGITPHVFAPASSSIAWPFFLAALRIGGLRDGAPLLLDVALGALLVVVIARALEDAGLSRRAAGFATIAVVLAIPLVPLVLSGMEHVLHAVAVLGLALVATRALAAGSGGSSVATPAAPHISRGAALRIAGLAAVAASARYETLAIVAILAALFALRRMWGGVVALLAGAFAPIAAQGAFAAAHGAPFVPVSILLKRSRVDVVTWPATVYYRLIEAPHVLALLALLAAAYVVRRPSRGPWERVQLLVGVAFAALLAQVAAGQIGWFYRYEAYAMALGLTALAATLPDLAPPARAAWAAPLLIITLPITGRALGALRATPVASSNIYEQQMQMAAFVREFYPGATVAVNDIGAVAYTADVRLVDLVGLGSLDVARAKGMRIDQPLTRGDLERLTRDVRVAIVYDDWFAASLPPSWKRAGRWRIHDNHVCAKDTVSFYSVARNEDDALPGHLRSFAPRLPAGVDDLPEP